MWLAIPLRRFALLLRRPVQHGRPLLVHRGMLAAGEQPLHRALGRSHAVRRFVVCGRMLSIVLRIPSANDVLGGDRFPWQAGYRSAAVGGATAISSGAEPVRRRPGPVHQHGPERRGAGLATHTEVMVLATDGGPDCNETLDPMTCLCVDRSVPACVADQCLDDGRTATTIASYAARGVPTYVIGLDSATLPDERTALAEMARAGGRPNTATGQPAYYSAQHADEVNAAFASITRSIAQCALATPSRPSDPGAIEVQIDGVTVPMDPTHTNGWDWSDPSFGQIALFGPTCDRLADPMASPVAIVHTCTARRIHARRLEDAARRSARCGAGTRT